MYAQYENAFPGTAERILKMADTEQNHRMEWENNSLEYATKAERRGQWMAFALAFACIGGAVVCGTYGQTTAAVALSVVSVSGIAVRFLDK